MLNYALSDMNSRSHVQWVLIFVVVILVFLPVTSSPSQQPYVCDGKFKDGGKPDQALLNTILSDHAAWLEAAFKFGFKKNDTRRANLCNANLSGADLSGATLRLAEGGNISLNGAKLANADLSWAKLYEAHFNKADLSGAQLYNADLSEADLSEANLSGADLSMADLGGADLSGADLRGASLINTSLTNTILSNAKFNGVDLEGATYEPASAPDKQFLGGIRNIDKVRFGSEKQSGLVSLRNSLKESGLRKLERKATYVIEKGKTDHASSLLEKYTRRLFFERTAGYGLYPGQCLIVLLSFIPAFSLIYFFAVYRNKESPKQQGSGVYRIWIDERIRKDLGSSEPELITAGFIKSIGYAFYFSLLSAFHIGWRDINVGNWIARLQPREYKLQSTGWVRTVSGIQSLISVYLLAFWVLTQFGRPFD